MSEWTVPTIPNLTTENGSCYPGLSNKSGSITSHCMESVPKSSQRRMTWTLGYDVRYRFNVFYIWLLAFQKWYYTEKMEDHDYLKKFSFLEYIRNVTALSNSRQNIYVNNHRRM